MFEVGDLFYLDKPHISSKTHSDYDPSHKLRPKKAGPHHVEHVNSKTVVFLFNKIYESISHIRLSIAVRMDESRNSHIEVHVDGKVKTGDGPSRDKIAASSTDNLKYARQVEGDEYVVDKNGGMT